MIPQRKRLPAYGRQLIAMRKAGRAPDQRGVMITDDWKRWKGYAWRAVVQDDTIVGALDFTFVAGLEVIVLAQTPERAQEIAAVVAHFNPHRLVSVSIKPPRIMPLIVPA